MLISAIHKCSNNPSKWRIGSGKCKFTSREAALNAFEKWVKSKSKEDYIELGQEVSDLVFVLDIFEWLDNNDEEITEIIMKNTEGLENHIKNLKGEK